MRIMREQNINLLRRFLRPQGRLSRHRCGQQDPCQQGGLDSYYFLHKSPCFMPRPAKKRTAPRTLFSTHIRGPESAGGAAHSIKNHFSDFRQFIFRTPKTDLYGMADTAPPVCVRMCYVKIIRVIRGRFPVFM